MASNVDIYIRGHNQASAAIQQVKTDLGGLDGAARTVAGGLSGIVGAVGVAGLAALGATAIRTAADFGDLGEKVARSEKYFAAFSGSSQAATANLEAMKRATDGAISTQEAMNAGASIMGMGLAKNAAELEKFARMAVLLGGNTRTATEAINEFQLLIANQSILRLDTFGISGAKVRARIEELQQADASLTREQAFLNAVMEEGTKKVGQLEAAGVTAGTSMDRLRSTTAELKAELSTLVEKPYTIVVEQVIKGVGRLTGQLEMGNAIANAFDPGAEVQQRLEEARAGLAALQQAKAEFDAATGPKIDTGIERQIGAVQALITALERYGERADDVVAKQQEFDAASIAVANSQEVLNNALKSGDALAIKYANDGLAAAKSQRDVAKASLEAAQGVGISGTAAEIAAGRYDKMAASATAAAIAQSDMSPMSSLAASAWASDSGSFYMAMTDAKIAEDKRYADELARQRERDKQEQISAARTAASEAQQAWESAMSKASSRIQGYLSQGMNVSIGLKDMRTDIFKAGANGPFEAIFRAQSIVQGGIDTDQDRQWAKLYGLTPETAAKIVADFQRGIFSPEVQGLVDVDALVNEAKMADLAEKSQEAFANAIAKKAGVKTNLVSSMFGFGDGAKATGEKADSNAKKQVDAAMNQVASAVGDTVKGKDFAVKMTGFGETIWGSLGKGIVDAAKKSDALQRAIDAMVESAISRKTPGNANGGGGATSAARSQGVPGI